MPSSSSSMPSQCLYQQASTLRDCYTYQNGARHCDSNDRARYDQHGISTLVPLSTAVIGACHAGSDSWRVEDGIIRAKEILDSGAGCQLIVSAVRRDTRACQTNRRTFSCRPRQAN